MTAGAGRIDVHAHYLPDLYRQAAIAAGHAQPDGMPALPAWSAVEHVAAMDRLGIATSLLSVSSPGVHFGDDTAAAVLARSVNEEGHRAVVDHPGRFGLFAALPVPDVDAAMAEIGHCYDRLDVDGVALLTNVGGLYLGDASLDPVFAELDRRNARVFLHPTSPACWEQVSLGRPRPMLEFLFDTTRAVVNLVLSGTVARHPNIEFIVPHAGAALPVIADRVAAIRLLLTDVDASADVLRDLGRLHYDLAGFPVPRQLDAVLALTTLEHLHYGSDFPFTPEFAVERAAAALDATGSIVDHLAVNTTRLFPRLHRHGTDGMTTEIILTGTGIPHPRPGRAGAGTLVRCGDVALQFDAGRSTAMRLAEVGVATPALTALFLTHVHSDHVVDVPDLVMSRWIQQHNSGYHPLTVVAPAGATARYVQRMLEPFDDDLAVRMEHIDAGPIEVDLRPFDVSATPVEVWRSVDAGVRVLAVGVHHEPVSDAVAYRVETPDGVVVISGDTRVCTEVEQLCAGADVVVHEACRTTALAPFIAGTRLETIFSYHADTVALGAMAARVAIPHVVLTHLIPAPDTAEQSEAFAQDLRDGGYNGRITVGEDLVKVVLDG